MTEQEVNNLIDSKIAKTKMSQLPEATKTDGLYSIGYNGNQSVKYKANLLQGDPLTVRKTYQTEALALADKNPIDTTTSLPLKVGQFVSIVDDGEKNGIYRISSISGDGTMSLELQGKLGDLSEYTKTGGSTKTTKEVDDDLVQLAGDLSDKLEGKLSANSKRVLSINDTFENIYNPNFKDRFYIIDENMNIVHSTADISEVEKLSDGVLPDNYIYVEKYDRPDLIGFIIIDINGYIIHNTTDTSGDIPNGGAGLPNGYTYTSLDFDRPDLIGFTFVDKHNYITHSDRKIEKEPINQMSFVAKDESAFTLYDKSILLPEKIYERFDNILINYNTTTDYITKKQIGTTSIKDMPIYCWEFKPLAPKKKILLIGGMHASEKVYQKTIGDFIEHVCNDWQSNRLLEYIRFNIHLVVIPLLCPANAVSLDGALAGGRRCAETEPIDVTWDKTGEDIIVTFDITSFPITNPNVSGVNYFSNENIIGKTYITIFDSNNELLLPNNGYRIEDVISGNSVKIKYSGEMSNGSGSARMVVYADPNRNLNVQPIWDRFKPGSILAQYGSDFGKAPHDNKGTKPNSLSEIKALSNILDDDLDVVIDCHSGAGTNYLSVNNNRSYADIQDNLNYTMDVIKSYSNFPSNMDGGEVDRYTPVIPQSPVPASYLVVNNNKIGCTIEWGNNASMDIENANDAMSLLAQTLNFFINTNKYKI